MSATRVLVVEDDPDLRRLLLQGLDEEGFAVELARTGREALALAEAVQPGLLIVDIGLPDSDGRDVCQALRSHGIGAPLLFLTARDAAPDRISGFGAGGDDYLTKPFDFAELVARLGALLKRTGGPTADVVGDLKLDPVTHSAEAGDKSIALTPTEFRVLGVLVARPGQAVRRRELIKAAWPDGAIVHDNTLDVYLGRLRHKLSALPSAVVIETVHGVGYLLR